MCEIVLIGEAHILLSVQGQCDQATTTSLTYPNGSLRGRYDRTSVLPTLKFQEAKTRRAPDTLVSKSKLNFEPIRSWTWTVTKAPVPTRPRTPLQAVDGA